MAEFEESLYMSKLSQDIFRIVTQQQQEEIVAEEEIDEFGELTIGHLDDLEDNSDTESTPELEEQICSMGMELYHTRHDEEKRIQAELEAVAQKWVLTYSEEESSDEEEWGDNAEGWGEDEEGWGEDEEEAVIDDDSTVDKNWYSLGYLDFSDHEEGRVENTLWYQLMVKHNNIVTEKRPPPPPPPPPPPQPTPPRQLPPLVRYARYLGISDDDEEEVEKLLCAWGWPPGPGAPSTTTGPTSHPAITV